MGEHLLPPERVANLIAVVHEQQIGMSHKPADFHDLPVHLVQLQHHFVELLYFVLTYDKVYVKC